MANSEGLSCPICLSADEEESMVLVHIEHGAVVPIFDVRICRDCAVEISLAWAAIAEARVTQAMAAGGSTGEGKASADETQAKEGPDDES